MADPHRDAAPRPPAQTTPVVPAEQRLPELTPKAVILGFLLAGLLAAAR